ncbi:MAG: thioredoxin domain-containing protein [bacterium]
MHTEDNDFLKYLTPIAVVLAGGLIALAVFYNGTGAGTTTNGQPQAAAVNIKDVNIENEPFIGDANAPVTIAEWSDYQCPYCKQFEEQTLLQIIKDYVDAGKVKVVFKAYPFLGADSDTADMYARSVWHLYPAQYFAWRNAMFAAQDAEDDQGFGDAASIDKMNATVAGLDAAKIAADVKANAPAYQAEIDANKAEAAKLGISGTPAFIIGKTLLPGAYPYANFRPLIDAELK